MPRILDHRTIIRDGKHNGFPSLTYWCGQYWVAFRSADRHHFSPGSLMRVFASEDRRRWHPAANVKIHTDGDNRDPTIMAFGDQLALMFVVVHPDGDDMLTRQYVAFSNNGYDWGEPRRILGDRDHIFRTREYDGAQYGVNIHRASRTQSDISLVKSDNLVDWDTVAPIGDGDMQLNETDLIFRPDGELWIVGRTRRTPDHAMFGVAKPPYTQWEMSELNQVVHAPLMMDVDGEVFMCGRCMPREHGDTTWPFGATLGVWRVTRGEAELIMRVPAVRDSSYAGWLTDPAGRVCMAYYSQHAYYLGVVEPFGALVWEDGSGPEQRGFASDIFFAELDLNA